MSTSLPAGYFEELYAGDPDPWRFASSDYERRKYAATLAALPHGRYASALEVGCSIGVLTRLLADRCDRLLSVDAAEGPLAAARQRNADAPWVEIRRASMPEEWPPDGSFDLILLSEVLYYFSRSDLALVAEHVRRTLRPGGDAVLVHWVRETNYPLSGDEAVAAFLDCAQPWLRRIGGDRQERYRLDVLTRG